LQIAETLTRDKGTQATPKQKDNRGRTLSITLIELKTQLAKSPKKQSIGVYF